MNELKKYKAKSLAFVKNAALFIVLLQFVFGNALAQTFDEDGSVFYKSGKVYVVVAVIGIVFVGLLIFLFLLERRIKNLEDQNKEKP